MDISVRCSLSRYSFSELLHVDYTQSIQFFSSSSSHSTSQNTIPSYSGHPIHPNVLTGVLYSAIKTIYKHKGDYCRTSTHNRSRIPWLSLGQFQMPWKASIPMTGLLMNVLTPSSTDPLTIPGTALPPDFPHILSSDSTSFLLYYLHTLRTLS